MNRKTDFGQFPHSIGRDERVLYSEWVPAGRFVRTIVGFASFLALGALLIGIWVSVVIQNPFWIVILGFALTLLLMVFWSFRGIRTQLTTEELLIDYGFLHSKHILVADVVLAEPTKADFGKYWGVGIRYGTDRSFAYTTSFGDAVKIVLKKGRPFVFSSHNPREICDIINQAKASIPLSDDS
jgi:hypothetical protein